MVCEKCGREIDDQSKFCIYCGASIKKEKYCLSCGEKNKEDALFCIKCGTPFDNPEEQKTLDLKNPINRYQRIVRIVLFCFAILLLFMNFGACFSNFLSIKNPYTINFGDNISVSLSKALEIMSEDNSSIVTGSALNASFVVLILIVPFLGTFVTLIVGLCLAFYRRSVYNKLPNMKKQVAISLAFLLCGLLMMGLFRSRQYLLVGVAKDSIRYGGFVLTSVCLSITYLILTNIHHLILQIIEKKGKNEILKSVFSLVISGIFIVLLFSASGSLFTWTVFSDAGKARMVFYTGNTLVGLQDLQRLMQNSLSEVYNVFTLMFLFNLAVIIVMVIFFTRHSGQLEKKKFKVSFASGITAIALGLANLIIANVCKNNYCDAFINSSDKTSLGAGPIVFMIFAVLLLASQIVEKNIVKSEN